ncbi:MAG: DUF559 domain-containing protein [Fimbriimonadaceae bacterium]
MPRSKERTRDQTERARRLRRHGSVVEEIFWSLARRGQLGFVFRRQHPVSGFTLDFYCAEAKLAIEFDGEQHDADRDRLRDNQMLEKGIETLRVQNREFFMLDSDAPRTDWIEAIIRRCEERTGRKIPR